jgi:purine nucleosidase
LADAIDVVIDTDIGSDPDDAIAIALAVASPELNVRGLTIVSGDSDWRAGQRGGMVDRSVVAAAVPPDRDWSANERCWSDHPGS